MDFHDNGVAYGRIELSSATYSSVNERECDIVLDVYAKRADYAGASDGNYSVSASGFSPSYDEGSLILSGKQWIHCGSFSKTVQTDGNGIASIDITVTVSVKSPSAGWKTSTGSLYEVSCGIPPTLAGASSVSVGANSVQMGKPLLITIKRDDPYCTHSLSYSFGSKFGGISNGVGTSYQWQVPDLSQGCYNATSGRCTITCDTYRNGSYLGSSSTSVTLTVPDPSKATVSSSRLTMGTATTVYTKRNSDTFKVAVDLIMQDTRKPLYEGQANSFGWTPSYDLGRLIPSVTEGSAVLECRTYNGTALVGTEKTAIMLIVPNNEKTRPKVTGLTVSPVSNLPSQFDGLYMRGKTGLRADITASSDVSTIDYYSLQVGTSEVTGSNPITMDVINSDGTVTVTAKAYDRRGFSASRSTTIQVISYAPPKVIPYTGYDDIVCSRSTETGALSPQGTYLAIKAGKKWTSVMLNGKEQNACSLRYRWKRSSDPDYGPWVDLLPEGSAEVEISTVIADVVSALNKSYYIELEAADKLGTEHKLRFSVMTEAISFVLYDGVDGAAFGKYPEEPHVVDIASHMTLHVRGKLLVDGERWIDLGLIEHSGVSPSGVPHGRHEDTGCFCTLVNGNRVVISFNAALDIGKTPAFVNAKEIPAEWRPPRPVSSLIAIENGMALVTVDPTGMILIPWADKWAEPTLPADWADGFIEYYV